MKRLIREELLNIIIIIAFLLQNSACQDECSPAFTLPNILKGIYYLFQIKSRFNTTTEPNRQILIYTFQVCSAGSLQSLTVNIILKRHLPTFNPANQHNSKLLP